MFAELFELVKEKGTLQLLVARSGDDLLSVTVVPQGDGPGGLKVPLTLVATPQELDEGFGDAVLGFQAARKSVQEQAEAAAKAVAAAPKAKPKPVAPRSALPTKVGVTEPQGEEEGEDEAAAEPTSATHALGRQAQSRATEAAGTIQLF